MIELIDGGYAMGKYMRETAMDNGEPLRAVTWDGPSVKGRILASEMEVQLKKETVAARIWSGMLVAGGWLGGILSAVAIKFLSGD